jgi:hypothetical protein
MQSLATEERLFGRKVVRGRTCRQLLRMNPIRLNVGSMPIVPVERVTQNRLRSFPSKAQDGADADTPVCGVDVVVVREEVKIRRGSDAVRIANWAFVAD